MNPEIAELFARDPLFNTEEDVEKLVAAFREARKNFNLGAAQAGARTRSKPKGEKAAKLGIDLTDLF